MKITLIRPFGTRSEANRSVALLNDTVSAYNRIAKGVQYHSEFRDGYWRVYRTEK